MFLHDGLHLVQLDEGESLKESLNLTVLDVDQELVEVVNRRLVGIKPNASSRLSVLLTILVHK